MTPAATANVFGDLVRVATAERAGLPCSQRAPEETRTDYLLRLLAEHGPMTTRALAESTGLPTNLVWGLLKGPRESGRVTFDSRAVWELPAGGSDRVAEAARLLRREGWRVEPPGETGRRTLRERIGNVSNG